MTYLFNIFASDSSSKIYESTAVNSVQRVQGFRSGRGIALMVNECRRVGIPDPEFHTDGNAVWIVFHYTRTTVGQDPTATPQQPYSNPTVTPQLGKLLSAIGNNTLSAKEIMEKTGMKDKRNFLKNYIHPAINSGLVLSLYPIGSKSPQQKYYLTDKGKGFLQQ